MVKRSVDDQINDVLMKLESATSESDKQAESVHEAYQLAFVNMERFKMQIRESCWTKVDRVTSHELPVSYMTERQNSWAVTSLQLSTVHLT